MYIHANNILLGRGFIYRSIHGFNVSQSFMYTQLYKITSKFDCNTYCNGQGVGFTRVLLVPV